MTKINLNANAMAKLLEKNSTRKSASEELRKLRMQTEGGMIWIDIDTDNKLLICKLKTGEKKPKFEKIGTKWPRIEKIILDFNLRQAGHLFDFEAGLIFCFKHELHHAGDTASAPLDQIEFDDEMNKMRIWTEFHKYNIFFKRKNDLEFMKSLISQIKAEAQAIIETLQKN